MKHLKHEDRKSFKKWAQLGQRTMTVEAEKKRATLHKHLARLQKIQQWLPNALSKV